MLCKLLISLKITAQFKEIWYIYLYMRKLYKLYICTYVYV